MTPPAEVYFEIVLWIKIRAEVEFSLYSFDGKHFLFQFMSRPFAKTSWGGKRGKTSSSLIDSKLTFAQWARVTLDGSHLWPNILKAPLLLR